MDDKQNEGTVVAFKGFDAEFKCRGYQFEVGKTYEHDGKVIACESGFHSCENPLDVLSYYSLCDSKFAVVEVSGELSRHDGDSKIASARLHIKAELSLPEFVKAAVAYVIAACKIGDNVQSASGHYAQLAASGHYAQLAASGHSAQLAASGDYAQLAASGHSAKLAASGHYAKLAASGDYAKLAASGDYAKLAASGHYAQLAASGHSANLAASGDYAQLAASGHSANLAASGHSAKLAASGDYAQLAASGKDSIIASSSYNATAKGAAGTWISLAEFNREGKCIGFATGYIGQDGLLPDTYYRAQGGKLVQS